VIPIGNTLCACNVPVAGSSWTASSISYYIQKLHGWVYLCLGLFVVMRIIQAYSYDEDSVWGESMKTPGVKVSCNSSTGRVQLQVIAGWVWGVMPSSSHCLAEVPTTLDASFPLRSGVQYLKGSYCWHLGTTLCCLPDHIAWWYSVTTAICKWLCAATGCHEVQGLSGTVN
jgi:hypothetical protein